MAQRGREGVAKRARERARQERQEVKRQRRQGGTDESPGPEPSDTVPPDEMALMEEFRLLSERHAGGFLDEAAYQKERHRIFVDLGIETDDDA
jgi:hypothetical protein